MRRKAAVGAALAFLLLGGRPDSQAGAQSVRDTGPAKRGPLITSVEIRGVSKLNAKELRDGLVTQPSECKSILYAPVCWITDSDNFTTRRYLDAVELRRDALRIRFFYWKRGYRDTEAVAATEPGGDGVRVIFTVTEGPPTVVAKLSVTQDDSVLSRGAIDASILLQDGDPLDLIALDSSVTLLRHELWDRGFADAIIDIDTANVSNEQNSGPITIAVHPGALTTVRAIEIEGNSKIADKTIRRLLTFGPGDRYRRDDVLESQRNLYLSGLFTEVEMRLPIPGDSAKVVNVRVAEGDLHRLNLTGGFTTADFVQLESEYIRHNFLGAARRLTIRGTVSNLLAAQLNGAGIFDDVTNGAKDSERDLFLAPTWSTSIDFTQPWLFSPRNQLGASVFAHRRSVPGIVIDRGAGATMALTRKLGPRSSGTLSYTYESTRIEASDVYFCVTFGVCISSTIQALAAPNPLAPIAAVLQVDRSNDPFQPDRGFRARAEIEHASANTGSAFQYNRAAASGSYYWRATRSGVLAGRVRLGWVKPMSGTNRSLEIPDAVTEPIIHPRRRFYAGGSQSVRGFGENQLGPRVLTISPVSLTDSADVPCTVQEFANRTCDPNRAGVTASHFLPQPLGGTSLAEASIEYRFPLLGALSGAVFVDGAVVGSDRITDLLGVTSAITPGFGIRFDTPVGLVRLDLGVRPQIAEELPVITSIADANGNEQLITLLTPRRYDPTDASGSWFNKALSRLTLHLSIGPAF